MNVYYIMRSLTHNRSPATTPPATARSPALLARVMSAPLGGGVPDAEGAALADDPDPDAIAAVWKASKVLPVAGALTEKTIPFAQWLTGLVCLQKNQRGELALLTVKLNWGI